MENDTLEKRVSLPSTPLAKTTRTGLLIVYNEIALNIDALEHRRDDDDDNAFEDDEDRLLIVYNEIA